MCVSLHLCRSVGGIAIVEDWVAVGVTGCCFSCRSSGPASSAERSDKVWACFHKQNCVAAQSYEYHTHRSEVKCLHTFDFFKAAWGGGWWGAQWPVRADSDSDGGGGGGGGGQGAGGGRTRKLESNAYIVAPSIGPILCPTAIPIRVRPEMVPITC